VGDELLALVLRVQREMVDEVRGLRADLAATRVSEVPPVDARVELREPVVGGRAPATGPPGGVRVYGAQARRRTRPA
jgi:hypothetical protein